MELCDCGFEAKTKAGLASHRRSKHPGQKPKSPGREPTTNAEAMERTISALGDRLEEVDAARIQALRSLADAVDLSPKSPGLWQQYREALGEVLSVTEDDDQEVRNTLAKIRSAS